jgi:hypothetical protein
MKIIIKIMMCLICVISTQLVFGQEYSLEYKKLTRKADSLFKAKEYKSSAQYYSLAFKTLGWKGTPIDRYNAARSWTLAHVPDSAFFCLDRLVNKIGYADYDKIIADEDLILLHSDKRWEPLINQVKLNKLPTEWYRAGSQPTSYQMLIDSSAGQDGKNVLTIKSTENKIDGFGTLMQYFLPDKYLGKRIRMTGYMKSADVKSWAGFWLRVDQENSKKSLSFDNMQDRAIKGTTEWKKYEIVLDVPLNASNIAFGALLDNTGQIWFEKLNFEIVDNSVPTTSKKNDEPNLDFEK